MSNLISVRPIRTEADYEAAVARIGELIDAAPNTVEGDELDVLATLADAYQKTHFPREASSPVEIIKMAMQERGLKASGMAIYFGEEARVSDFLNGKRSLTTEQVRRLSGAFNIPSSLLLGPPEERWKVPRNRRQYVYKVTERQPVPGGSPRFVMVGHFTGEFLTFDMVPGNPNVGILRENDFVYHPPEAPGDFYACEIDGEEAFITGYSRPDNRGQI